MSVIRSVDDAYAAGAALGRTMPPLSQDQADLVAAILASDASQQAAA